MCHLVLRPGAGAVAVERVRRVRRARRRGRGPRRRQRHVAHRLADDLPDRLQERVSEVRRAARTIYTFFRNSYCDYFCVIFVLMH